jgi:hypothetical protein
MTLDPDVDEARNSDAGATHSRAVAYPLSDISLFDLGRTLRLRCSRVMGRALSRAVDEAVREPGSGWGSDWQANFASNF